MLTEIPTDTTQLFASTRLSESNPECTACNRTLRKGEQVTIYAARQEAPTFTIERLYCRKCTPEELTSPTLGLSEHLLQSHLTRTLDVRTQREYQTLGIIRTVDASAPIQGSAEAHEERGRADETSREETRSRRRGSSRPISRSLCSGQGANPRRKRDVLITEQQQGA